LRALPRALGGRPIRGAEAAKSKRQTRPMVVFYRESPKVCSDEQDRCDSSNSLRLSRVGHLATVVPHNPVCDKVSHPNSWWRVEGYFYDLEEDQKRRLVTCPACQQTLLCKSC
jgi:hypothetical protein